MIKEKLPDGWKEVELGEIIEFQKKSTIKAGEGNAKGKFKFFTSSDKQTKFLDTYKLAGEYLIFATGGHAGIHYCNEKFSTSTDCFVVKAKDNILSKYIYYYLYGKTYLLEEGFKGAGLKHISKEYLKKLKIIYPEDKTTQQKIVSILEKVEQTKQMRAESDELINKFLQAVFLEMFGDPITNEKRFVVKELGDVCNKVADGTHFSPPNSNKGEYKYITAKNIKKHGFDLKNLTFIDEKHHKEIFRRCNPEYGDVLYIKDGVTTGIAMVNTLKEEFSLLSSVALFKLKNQINPHYLSHYLNNSSVYDLIRRSMGGAAITRLTVQKLKRINVLIPSLPLQQKFASIVEKAGAMRATQKSSKQEIENLFNALMQKAFNGELVAK